MVPVVTEVWRPQPAHSSVQAFVSGRQALPPSWADKPVGPERRCKVLSAGSLIADALLELNQGAGKIGHQGSREQFLFVICSITDPGLAATTFFATGRRGVRLSARTGQRNEPFSGLG